MKLVLSLFLLYTLALAQNKSGDGDLASIIEEVFGKKPDGDRAGQDTTGGTVSGTGTQSGGQDGQNAAQVSQSPVQNGADVYQPAVAQTPATNVNNDDFNLSPSASTATGPKNKDCVNESGQKGDCVPYYLCNDNNTIIDDGVGVIDIRVNDGACESYLETCCLPPDEVQIPITPAPTPATQARTGCGWRNPDGVGFRIKNDNDNEAKFGEFPWMVAVLKIELVDENEPNGEKLNVYACGGSLFHPSVVLTGAHCVKGLKNIRVRAGEWDTQTQNEIYPYQDRDVSEVVIHQDFNPGNLFYDVALLFLNQPMELTQNVGVVCLPPPRETPRTGARCQAAGWGKDQFSKEGRYQVILKRVEVPVVDHNTCQTKLQQTRLGKHFRLHSSFMCAGGEPGKDTCKGDGGSPLACPIQFDEDRYQQNGMVAWGIGCGENGVPGVYVDVANVRAWIDDKVIGKGFDEKIYTF